MIDLNIVRQIWLKTAAVKRVPWDDPEEIERSPWKEILEPFLREVAQQIRAAGRANEPRHHISQNEIESVIPRHLENVASELFRNLDAAQALIGLGEIGGVSLPGRSLALPALIYEAARIGGQSHLPPLHRFPFKRILPRSMPPQLRTPPGETPDTVNAWENFVRHLQAELLLYEKLLRERYPLTPEQQQIRQRLMERLPLEAAASGRSSEAWARTTERPLFVVDTVDRGRTFDTLFGTSVVEPGGFAQPTIIPNPAIPLYSRRLAGASPDWPKTSHEWADLADALLDRTAALKGRLIFPPEATIRLLPSIQFRVTDANDIQWAYAPPPESHADPIPDPLIRYQSYPTFLADLVEAAGQRTAFTPFLDAARILRRLPPGHVPTLAELADPTTRLAALGLSPEAIREAIRAQDIRPWAGHRRQPHWHRVQGVIKALTSPAVPIEIP